MQDNLKKHAWDASYTRKDGYVFYPHEEIIRFYSKYIRKKIGLEEFEDRVSFNSPPKVLDVGCGIGRHLVFGSKMGVETYGVDLSSEAVNFAKRWLKTESIKLPDGYIFNGSITDLPWQDNFFDFAVSHGVLDSMYNEIAQQGVQEVARVLKKGALFYCDLISGDDFEHAKEYSGDEVVETDHEQGTVQSYYNYGLIEQLFNEHFKIKEAFLIKKEEVQQGYYISRWHLVVERI